jgi:hypothetical protein
MIVRVLVTKNEVSNIGRPYRKGLNVEVFRS